MKPLIYNLMALTSLAVQPVLAQPVVLELFTSQGCSSCPPAEAYLQELSQSNTEIIPLAYHVNYWDRLGWKDPFATPANTQRQYAYATDGRVFTPELRVNGVASLNGADRRMVPQAVAKAFAVRRLTLTPNAHGQADVALPVDLLSTKLEALMLLVQDAANTDVANGENGGRRLQEANMVLAMQPLEIAQDGTLQVPLPPRAANRHVVVVLQEAGQGRILAAGTWR